MNYPSVRTIERVGITREQAKLVRALMVGDVDPNDPDKFPATAKWVSQCYNRPYGIDMIMSAINEVIEGFGVEALELVPGSFSNCQSAPYWNYVNLGDTYKTTVMCHSNGRFRIGCWGDIAERLPCYQ